ncbi:MAG: dihydropteroate synthase, partial [Flavobacteriales bacterium]|nr:dihydropteroate synthase [Flavobacteriales bacterium]
GRFARFELALQHCEHMLEQGATIIDVGAQSSRPGAERLSAHQEIAELEEVLPKLVARFPQTLFSVDTFYGEVARYAVQSGAGIINDISACRLDPEMFTAIVELKVPYILMHMKGEPQSMQQMAKYLDVVEEVTLFLAENIDRLHQNGLTDIWVDPGFGFGKTLEHNYALLQNLTQFQILEKPLVVGLSRKSMINKVLNISPHESLNGTTVLHTIALLNGASILRVHDVKEAVEAIKLIKTYFSTGATA